MKKGSRKITSLLSSLLLLITPLIQLEETFASTQSVEYKTDNRESIEDNLRSASNAAKSQATKKYYQAVKDQLSARGVDTSKLNFDQMQNKTVKIIVELAANPAVKQNITPTGSKKSIQRIDQASNKVIDNQASIQKQVESITGNKVRRTYGYLINGFSISAKPAQIAQIKKVAGVKNVTVAKVYHPADSSANELANVQKVWSANHLKGEGMVVAVLDTGIDPNHKDLRLTDPSKEKITPAQGNSFAQTLGYGKSCNDKVPFAYNYADGTSETILDTGTTMHGMHVAGIVAANGSGDDPKTSVQGVAPEAQLLDMKVFSNTSEGATDDDIISAIEDSVKIGADVINMSLGSTSGDVNPKDPEQMALSNAAKQGVIPVISAGNSGLSNSAKGDNVPFYQTEDTSTVGAPGVTPEAITVASSENSSRVTNVTSITDPAGKKLLDKDIAGQLSNKTSFETASGHAFYLAKNGKDGLPGIGKPADFDESVKGKIAVVARGQLAFTEKQDNAKKAGAVGIVIVDNNPNNANQGFSWHEDFPSLGVTTEDGKELIKAIQAAPDTIYTITVSEQQVPNSDSGRMSSFTSFGPTSDLSFKPDITAPGGQIWSLANDNKYQNMSGTSMASPFIAGSTAILVESLKKEGINLSKDQLTKFAKISLMNTAKPMMDLDNKNNVISPREQGSGLIQLDKAVDNRVTATTPSGEGSFALKEIGQNAEMVVTLTNRSNEDVKYTFNNHGGPWTGNDEVNKNTSEVPISGGSLTTDENSVTVPANGKKDVTVHLSLPMSFAQQKFVEGYIGFDSDKAPNLVIPYLGFHGKWGQGKVIDAPSWEKGSVFGGGYFKDGDDNILGTDLAGDDRENQKEAPDFSSDPDKLLSYIKPDTVAISPNNDGHQDYAYPTFYLYRNAHNSQAQIINSTGSVIKTVYKDTSVKKSFYDAEHSSFTTATDGPNLIWDGTHWNAAKGKDVPVVDGVYKYRFSAIPNAADAKAQTQDLTIRVDTVKPKLTNIKLIKRSDGMYLSANLSDNNSGIQNMGILNVTINGVSHNYNLYNDKGDPVSIHPYVTKLVNAQSSSLTPGKNQIEVGVLDNAANYGYTKSLTTVPGKAAKGLALYNLQDKKRISTVTPYVNTSNSTFRVNGSYIRNVYVNGRLGKLDRKGIFSVNVPIPANGVFKFSTDAKGKKLIRTVRTVIAMKLGTISVNDANRTVNTDKKDYELSGSVGPTVKKVTIKGSKTKVLNVEDFAKDRTFKASFDLKYGSNKFTVTATDVDGNISKPVSVTVNTTYDDDPKNQVFFDDGDLDIAATKVITTKTKGFDSRTGMFTISGKLKKPVGTFKIAGDNVSYDPQTLKFSKTVQLPTNGYKSIWIYVADEQGKALVDGSVHFAVDTNLPTLTFKDSAGWQQDNKGDYHFSTLKKPFVLTGSASDNFSGFGVLVNNNVLEVTPQNGVFSVQTGFSVDFSTTLNLIKGLNKFNVSVVDATGNIVSHNLYITYRGI